MGPAEKLRGSKSKLLEGKKILVAVSSSIGAIETPKLIRELIRHGAQVYTIATEESKNIIGEYALEFASGNRVHYKITGNVEHVSLYEICHAMIVHPATANIISKIALGIADNIVNTTAMMFMENKPIFIVPSMHKNMLHSIRNHIDTLKERQVFIISPRMEEEKAKVPSIEEIVLKVIEVLGKGSYNNGCVNGAYNEHGSQSNKKNKKILILSGGTAEFIDKVRIITNLSSGKTGYHIAEAFSKEGHNVEVIYALGKEPPYYVKSHKVITSKEMLNKALELGKDADIIVSCAAISDFIPDEFVDGKIKSDSDITLKLKRNTKVIRELRRAFPEKTIVGFKAEYGVDKNKLIEIGREKLREYNLDYIVANDLSKYYFGEEYNEVILIGKNSIMEFKGKKSEIMEKIVKEILRGNE